MAVPISQPAKDVDQGRRPFVPPYPWEATIEESSLSTKRGFVFQYPPFGVLGSAGREIVDRPVPSGLYIHIPFCPYRCAYCYYAVEVRQQEEQVDRYISLLSEEMKLLADSPVTARHRFTTAFIGGGTPTYLDEGRLQRLFEQAHKHFRLDQVHEFSVEADPTTMSSSKAKTLKDLGVNRMSIGVQSFSDPINSINDRFHSRAQAYDAVDAVRDAGIDNLNLDLICGLIGETAESWAQTVRELVALGPEHVTVYLFSFRPQTTAYSRVKHGRSPEPPEEEERVSMFRHARTALLEAGYLQTTPNCFIREPRFEQIHQRNAWSSEPLVGVGNSAYSYVDDCVTQNYRSVAVYGSHLTEGRIPVEIGRRLNALELMIRYCVLRLKLLSIDRARFMELFGFELDSIFGRQFEHLQSLGLVDAGPGQVALTEKGILYVDDACRELYSAGTQQRLAELTEVSTNLRASLL